MHCAMHSISYLEGYLRMGGFTMKTLVVLSIWFAIIALLWYINRNARKQTDYMNQQFTSPNERTKQAIANERDWREHMEKYK